VCKAQPTVCSRLSTAYPLCSFPGTYNLTDLQSYLSHYSSSFIRRKQNSKNLELPVLFMVLLCSYFSPRGVYGKRRGLGTGFLLVL
jgi:hypothetical protein